jgi:hypothetical protein
VLVKLLVALGKVLERALDWALLAAAIWVAAQVLVMVLD